MTTRPSATARPVFEMVAQRVGVDANTLMYLVSECLSEVIKQAEATGSCTMRGQGKFTVSTLAGLISGKSNQSDRITVFERTKFNQGNRPFQALQLKKRLAVGT